jgi:hypothetical protein
MQMEIDAILEENRLKNMVDDTIPDESSIRKSQMQDARRKQFTK